MEKIRKPLCFGTDEYGEISPICRKCKFFKECAVITPKKPNTIIPRKRKVKQTLQGIKLK